MVLGPISGDEGCYNGGPSSGVERCYVVLGSYI